MVLSRCKGPVHMYGAWSPDSRRPRPAIPPPTPNRGDTKPHACNGAASAVPASTWPAVRLHLQVGAKEITLDDMWALDVQKLDGWQLVRENTVGEEVFKQAAAAGDGGDDSDWTDASGEGDR
jgi:hypothetical protein